jgi:tellurite resistance protein
MTAHAADTAVPGTPVPGTDSRPAPAARRIPPNLFGIGLGLAGLSEAWAAARPVLAVPIGVSDAIGLAAAAIWLLTLTRYLAQGHRQVRADLRDPVLAPFVSAAVITPMILAAELSAVAPTAGRALVIIFLSVTVLLGGLMTGQWIAGDLSEGSFHPGYFLPTVAGGLVGSTAASVVHLHVLAQASFGIGLICWLLLGPALLNRLFFRPSLPAALVPTLAIEMAPPVVAGVAYFALTGGSVDFIAAGLAGCAVLMALVQLRFIPLYTRLRFTPVFWAFTFSYAAKAMDALRWMSITRPPGATGYSTAALGLITMPIAGIAIRSVVAIRRGQFLPAVPGNRDHDG